MNKKAVEQYRDSVQSRLEELTVNQAKQSSDIIHIKESVGRLETLVKEQNGRVRKNEQLLSAISAIGGVVSIIFAGFIGWLFKIRG